MGMAGHKCRLSALIFPPCLSCMRPIRFTCLHWRNLSKASANWLAKMQGASNKGGAAVKNTAIYTGIRKVRTAHAPEAPQQVGHSQRACHGIRAVRGEERPALLQHVQVP